MTRLNEFLHACSAAERAVGQFYRFLEEAFADHDEAACSFRKLAEEEEGHARTFDFLRTLARETEARVGVKPSFAGNLDRLDLGLEKARERLGANPSLAEAVGMALLLEATFLERDKAAFVEVPDPEFKRLIQGLAQADAAHRKELERLRSSLGSAG